MLNRRPQVRSSLTSQVFGALSATHRAVLWNIEVERYSITEVTNILGISPKEVVIQLSTARVCFRNKWTELQNSNVGFSRGCQWTVLLTQTSNKTKFDFQRRPQVIAHLKGCLRCAILVDESDYLTQHLRETLAPLLVPSGSFEAAE